MITSWRIVGDEHAEGAFSGAGAARFGARWNPAGTKVVYTAQSAALAALELLVHLDFEEALDTYLLFACHFEPDLVEPVDRDRLPRKWHDEAALEALQQIGAEWLLGARKPILEVPSAIIPTEYNYLLNPSHPDFARITIAEPTPFRIDLRLLRR